MSTDLELIVDTRAVVGEGPIWDSKTNVLYWLDIINGEVHIYDPAVGQDTVHEIGQMVGTIVPCKRGGVMLALKDGFATYDLKTKKMEMIVDPEEDKPTNRFNDGKCDPAGRFWAGTLSLKDEMNVCGLYRLDPDLSVHKMLDSVSISNGIVWSLDAKIMYYIDTPTRKLDAFDYDVTSGAIANRRVAIEFPGDMGYPDGMTIDSEGNVWIGFWEGSHVLCFNPTTGKILHRIEMPVTQITACWFGGHNYEDLYITTAALGLDEAALAKQPKAGSLYRCQPGPQGLPAHEFSG